MIGPSLPAGVQALLAIVLAVGPGTTVVHAQVSGLIKKKAAQIAQSASAGEEVAFNDAVLELTPERIAKVIAAKEAAKRLASAPTGPAAIRQKLDALDAQQAKIYEKQVGAINAWDVKRQDAERCRDSLLAIVSDQLNLNSAEYQQKMTQVALRYAQAQQRGDSAEMRRVEAELKRGSQPSPADSAKAVRACPLPPPAPEVREWQAIKAEMEKVQQELDRSQQAVTAAEETTSGMNHRQLGIACERMLLYLGRAKAKQKQVGFTSAELVALEEALKQLQGTCT